MFFPSVQHRVLLAIHLYLETYAADWHLLNMGTDAEESKSLNLANPDDWKSLVEKKAKHLKTAAEIRGWQYEAEPDQ